MAPGKVNYRKTEEEKILLDFKAFVQKSYAELAFDASGEKEVVLTNKRICIDNTFQIELKDVTKVEYIKKGKDNAVLVYYKSVRSDDLGKIKLGGVFSDPNIEKFFGTLKTLIPESEHLIKRDYYGEAKRIFMYLAVLITGFVTINRIQDSISKFVIILLLIFLSVVFLSDFIPFEMNWHDLQNNRKIARMLGISVILAFIVISIVFLYLYFK